VHAAILTVVGRPFRAAARWFETGGIAAWDEIQISLDIEGPRSKRKTTVVCAATQKSSRSEDQEQSVHNTKWHLFS
jgi:hypothetical protein